MTISAPFECRLALGQKCIDAFTLVFRIEQELKCLALQAECGFQRRILAVHDRLLYLFSSQRGHKRDFPRQFQGFFKRFTFFREPAYKSVFFSFRCRQHFARQCEQHSLVLADRAQKALRAACSRHQSELYFWLAETGGSCSYNNVGVHCQLAPAT
ncbi:hypothetical protein DK59_3072 [Brucella abortus bv. 4 str. 292]|nr:hypothetical protein DK59_3072 [Brucella abortus bv. 4 str. 292]